MRCLAGVQVEDLSRSVSCQGRARSRLSGARSTASHKLFILPRPGSSSTVLSRGKVADLRGPRAGRSITAVLSAPKVVIDRGELYRSRLIAAMGGSSWVIALPSIGQCTSSIIVLKLSKAVGPAASDQMEVRCHHLEGVRGVEGRCSGRLPRRGRERGLVREIDWRRRAAHIAPHHPKMELGVAATLNACTSLQTSNSYVHHPSKR